MILPARTQPKEDITSKAKGMQGKVGIQKKIANTEKIPRDIAAAKILTKKVGKDTPAEFQN